MSLLSRFFGAKSQETAPHLSWWERLSLGLARSSSKISTNLTQIFTHKKLDLASLESFEDMLIEADFGLESAASITAELKKERFERGISDLEVKEFLKAQIVARLLPVALPLVISHKPHVIIVAGVNGVGKTTTIGKIAAKLTNEGKKVTLCAGDTFRAAAIEQLTIWAERTGSTIIKSSQGADAASLAFDALAQAKENGSDVLLIDTAGRLQNKAHLMEELSKIVRVLKKSNPEAPHSSLLVLDATTGQNALRQVEAFHDMITLTGLVMTKLDGTAKGGILVAVADKFKLPLHYIGVGEQVNDLEAFAADDFAKALLGT
jgi:fused signal recognition particle receptor